MLLLANDVYNLNPICSLVITKHIIPLSTIRAGIDIVTGVGTGTPQFYCYAPHGMCIEFLNRQYSII